ncbi:MAG: radical SAM protein [Candidatus Omnitrophota bacterium]|nr:radical SAM protein [Candidatus Omnitrophota bacterium]
MRALLINPSQEKVYGMKMSQIYPPLGLLYVGTVIKLLGHEVRLLDIDIDKVTPVSFREKLSGFKPGLIVITSVTPTVKDALSWARAVKEYDSSIRVIIGGIHATIDPVVTAEKKEIDFVVVGEGEKTVEELVKAIDEGKNDYSGISGILYKEGGRVIRNKPRELIANLDDITFPDRSLLRSLNDYVPPDAVRTPVATIMTSRGCPGDCTFCCTKQIFTRHVRLRSVKNIMDEIDMLVAQHGVKEIHIADDTFTINKQRVLDFCKAILQRNYDLTLEFMNGIRADCVDEDILKALRSIKVRNVGFGVESGNKEVLKLARKNISLDRVRSAFKLAKKFGFETWAFFIIGLPGETEQSVRESIDFAKELDPDFAKFLILKPYPGSEAFSYLSERALIDNYDYDMYGVYTQPVHHLPGMSKDDMIRWQKKAFTGFYLRPSKVMSHLLRIRSLTQLSLVARGFVFVVFNIFKRRK